MVTLSSSSDDNEDNVVGVEVGERRMVGGDVAKSADLFLSTRKEV